MKSRWAGVLLLTLATVGCGGTDSSSEANSAENVAADENDRSQKDATAAVLPAVELPMLTNSIGMKLVLIPAGEFMMGSPASERRRTDDEHQHRVQITRSFYMQTTEVTQEQFEAVMGAKPWSGKEFVKEGLGFAASYVTWDEAVEFCRKLSKREGVVYRLPTEAEWEYACRAGSVTAYIFGDNCYGAPGSGKAVLDAYGWWSHNAGDIGEKYPHHVGRKRANAWGLYDMHGNVNEWCSDRWIEDYYRSSPSSDPQGPDTGRARVHRGGAWNSFPGFCRSAARGANPPGLRDWGTGFRVVAVRVDPK